MKRINEIHAVSLRDKEPQYSLVRDSISSLRSIGHESDIRKPGSTQLQRKVQSVSSVNTCGEREKFGDKWRYGNERKIATLPRGHVTEIEETLMISRRTSISNGLPTEIGL